MNDHLQSERIAKHLQDVYGTEPEYLWAQYPTCSVFRHPLSKKWYAIILDISKSRLGLEGDEPVTVLILLDGSVPDEKIVPLSGKNPPEIYLTLYGLYPRYNQGEALLKVLKNYCKPMILREICGD